MELFGYTLIKTSELKELKIEKDRYIQKWLDENTRLNSIVEDALTKKESN